LPLLSPTMHATLNRIQGGSIPANGSRAKELRVVQEMKVAY
jgi:hypothetical protein